MWTAEDWKQFFAQEREWTEDDWALFLDAAHGAPLEWRQAGVRAIVDDVRLLGGFAPEDATLIVAVLLEGSLVWSGPPEDKWADGLPDVPNDFLAWVDADWGGEARANLPDPAGAGMNCWEFVLYAAFISGQASYEELAGLRPKGDDAITVGYYGDAVERALGVGSAEPWSEPGDERRLRGRLVFFDGTGHVAILLGTRDEDGDLEILSLWTVPCDDESWPIPGVQRIVIGGLRDDAEQMRQIKFSEVSWGPNRLSELGER